MGAVPKRKISKRRSKTRANHLALKGVALVTCPRCGAPVRPHHVCTACGTYQGIQVVEVKE
jgi:large subunit ribosomal protein L32